jgi:hypothetical protein
MPSGSFTKPPLAGKTQQTGVAIRVGTRILAARLFGIDAEVEGWKRRGDFGGSIPFQQRTDSQSQWFHLSNPGPKRTAPSFLLGRTVTGNQRDRRES